MGSVWPVFLFGVVMVVSVYFARSAKEATRRQGTRHVGECAVVAKRTQVAAGGIGGQTYFATFEANGGQRLELEVPKDIYGVIAEGDLGVLTFVNDLCLEFERRTLR